MSGALTPRVLAWTPSASTAIADVSSSNFGGLTENDMEWSNAPLATILRVAVAAAFAIGGTINLAGRGAVKHDFARWGYPAGFNFVCGGLELVGAMLLLGHTTRLWGLALLGAIMAAAIFTLIRNTEPFRHIVPALVFSVLLSLAAAVSV
jgi:uncharacterized membrane protein YphA (DoxX/SURF4 family)